MKSVRHYFEVTLKPLKSNVDSGVPDPALRIPCSGDRERTGRNRKQAKPLNRAEYNMPGCMSTPIAATCV